MPPKPPEENESKKHSKKETISSLKARISILENEIIRIYSGIVERNAELDALLKMVEGIENIDPETMQLIHDTCHDVKERIDIAGRLGIELTESDALFLSKLQKHYLNMNPEDVKMCLCIKLGYDVKMIEEHTGISKRGQESFRKRLHDKIGLLKQQSIKTYLERLATTNGES